MTELRVASINTHMAVPEGFALVPANERIEAIEDIAAFIVAEDIDVALMQEVRNDAPGARAGGVPRQLERLVEAVGASSSAYGLAVSSHLGDEYGICILARGRARVERPVTAFLPFAAGRERRVMLFAQLRVGDIRAVIANLHLDHTGLDRRAQLTEVERILADLLRHRAVRIAKDDHDYIRVAGYDGPLIVGGDFNDAAHVVARELTAARLCNVLDGLESDDPLRADTHVQAGRIDHLLLGPDVEIVDQQLLEVPMHALAEGSGVTDHLAIVATLHVRSAYEATDRSHELVGATRPLILGTMDDAM